MIRPSDRDVDVMSQQLVDDILEHDTFGARLGCWTDPNESPGRGHLPKLFTPNLVPTPRPDATANRPHEAAPPVLPVRTMPERLEAAEPGPVQL